MYEHFIYLSVGTKKEGAFIYALPLADKKTKTVRTLVEFMFGNA